MRRRLSLLLVLVMACGADGPATTTPTRPTASQLIFDGQSLALAPEAATSFPQLLLTRLPTEWYPEHETTAVGGTTYGQRAADAHSRLDPLVSRTLRSVLIDVAGQRELRTYPGAFAAEDLLAGAEGYARARRDAGVDLYLIATVPPSLHFSPEAERDRVAYNELLRGSDAFDGVVDLAALPEVQDPSDEDWFSDGLHPTAALTARFAAAVEAVLEELGLPV